MPLNFQPGAEFARQLDAADPLASFRDEFVIADPDLLYLDGNSLGRLPKAAQSAVQTAVADQWGESLVRGWNAGWWSAPTRVGAQIAKLIGAKEHEVIVCDSTSVNLFKLVVAALRLQAGRSRVVSDCFNFPSDLYVIQGALDLLGRGELSLVDSRDSVAPDLAAFRDLLNEQTALVELSHVVFKSGYLYDMKAVTGLAHEAGALIIWDLCHSAGALPIALNDCNADMAVGCGYKYLNGGPGAPAFLYVREDLLDRLHQPIWGWIGRRDPFSFDLAYEPAAGAQRFLAGTPNVLSLAALEPGVEMLNRAGMERVRAKSESLTAYLIFLFDRKLAQRGFTLGSPREASRRGSHISIRHADAYRINRAMIERVNVIPDFRTPDNIRLGLVPLYTSYAEVHEAVTRICRVIDERIYEQFAAERLAVT